jgi:hypothetical protein
MSGLSFRQYKQISKCKCHWNTIYNFFISLNYRETVNRYTNKYLNKSPNISYNP